MGRGGGFQKVGGERGGGGVRGEGRAYSVWRNRNCKQKGGWREKGRGGRRKSAWEQNVDNGGIWRWSQLWAGLVT